MATKKTAAPVVTIQSIMGGEITLDEILGRIRLQTGDQELTHVYIKAEENRAYYIAGEEGGCVVLWE